MKRVAKQGLRRAIPLLRRVTPVSVRRGIVAELGRRAWVPYRSWLSIELLRDLAERDPNACHRFLWTHHLAYAETYEADLRFGEDRINKTRHLLFDDLRHFLVQEGIDPERDIRSVFEVGCSLGYLLRHLETGLFGSATILEGIDIDRRAIEEGASYLASIGSKVEVTAADMCELERVLEGRTMDVILCAGVLLYLREEDAREVVRSILRHAGVIAAFAGLAHPAQDNAGLANSAIRERDGTFIHNIDAMVNETGGQVAWRRWEGPRLIDGNTIYFVFARPVGG